MLLNLFLACVTIFHASQALSITGTVPPNYYTSASIKWNKKVQADITWNSTATNLVVIVFKPGQVIDSISTTACGCITGSRTTQTVSYTSGIGGTKTFPVWVMSRSGPPASYSIVIKADGTITTSETQLIGNNASYHLFTVSSLPCQIWANISGWANVNVFLYAPGVLFTAGTPIFTLAYTANSGNKEFNIAATVLGNYYLMVQGNPASPGGGWPSILYYFATINCATCSTFLSNCLTCTNSTLCLTCGTNYTVVAGKCVCNILNCVTCTSGTVCTKAAVGYYVNSTFLPQPCSIIPLCLECTSNILCTKCSTTSHYFDSTAVTCKLCSTLYFGCTLCNQTFCFTCASEYYFNITLKNCTKCDTTLTQCQYCVNNTVCTGCYGSFFLNTTTKICDNCTVVMTACLQCTDKTHCTQCLSPTYLYTAATTNCQLCNVALPYCITCTDTPSLKCFTCDFNYYLDSTTFQCFQCNHTVSQCIDCTSELVCKNCTVSYYLKQPSLCQLCSTPIPACGNCSIDGLICYACIGATYVLVNPDCILCSTLITNCSECSAIAVCTKCDTTYYPKASLVPGQIGCELCSIPLAGCVTCINDTYCQTIINNQYCIYPNGLTDFCNVPLNHCLNCASSSNCILCENLYFLSSGHCFLCQQKMKYCIECTSIKFCITCSQGFIPTNNNCSCILGWYVEAACTQVYGCIYAQMINNQSVCLQCQQGTHFVYNITSHQCDCAIGYYLDSGACVETCGDGTHFAQACDDGNYINGDGCNKQCATESGYICIGDSYEPSQCFINQLFTFSYLYTVKVDGQNQGKIYFSVNPQNDKLYSLNLTELISSSNMNINQSLTATYQGDRIEVTFNYNEPFINQHEQIKFDFSSKAYNNQPTSISFSTVGMQPPLRMSNQLSLYSIISLIGTVLSALLGVLFILSLFFHKMIGVQTILVVQIIYSMGCLGMKSPQIFRIFLSLNPIMAISQLFQNSRISLIQPQLTRYFTEGRAFLLSLNISTVLFTIVLILYSVNKVLFFKTRLEYKNCCTSLFKNDKRQVKKDRAKREQQKSLLQQQKIQLKAKIVNLNSRQQFLYQRLLYPAGITLLIPFIVFFTINLISSIKGQNQLMQFTSNIIINLIFSIIMSIGICQMRKLTKNNNESQQKFTFRRICQSLQQKYNHRYSSLFVMHSILSIAFCLIGFLTSSIVGLILIIILTVMYILIIKYLSPYQDNYHNKILLFNYGLILIQSVTIILDMQQASQTVLLMLTLVIFILLYASVILTIYRIYLDNQFDRGHVEALRQSVILQSSKVKQPKRKIKDSLQFNPYLYKDLKKNISPIFDIKNQVYTKNQKLTQQLENKTGQNEDLTQIKQRLRKQINYMKSNEDDGFAYRKHQISSL